MDIREEIRLSKEDKLPESSGLPHSGQQSVKGRRGLVSPKKGKSDSPKKRQRSSSPRKGRVVMSERVFNPTPITQFNPVTNEVLNDNVKLAVMTEDADIVKENPVSVNEKLAAVVKDPLRYSRSVKGKPAGVMNKLSLGKSNVPVAKADVVKSSVDKEALVDKASVLSVTKTNVLTQLETAPDVVNDKVSKESVLSTGNVDVVQDDPAKVVIQSVLTQLENAPDVENSAPDVGKISSTNLFAMQGDKLENVFEAHFEKFVLYGIRLNLETLSPGLWLDANVIDCWGAILNYEERFRAADSKSRHFFPTGCITESMLDGTFTSFDEKWKRFSDQVNAQFNGNEGGRGLEGIDLKKLFSRHLKLYGHPRHATVARVKHTIPKVKWKTKENFYDCGIFTMLHMENFNGGPASDFDCGLPVESQLQLDILRRLRFKFATKILLHEINLQSEKMVEFAKEFDKKGPSEKISIIIDAIMNREERDRIDN
ncbi:ulp1 protease family, C-terminal catalytic domain-containing protein [Tanacetum coccineum]